MHCVTVTGGNKTQRDLVEDACYFFIKHLMPKCRKMEIEIHLKKMTGDAVGYCLMTDTIRDYEIEIDKSLSIKNLILTLAHEMVHVKQYYNREMVAVGWRWKNAMVKNDTPYFELPWEKEAYKMQAKVAKAFWIAEEN
jgi:hypothetical protein